MSTKTKTSSYLATVSLALKYGLGAALLAGVTALGAMEARAQLIDQLADAVRDYPTAKVTLSIVGRVQVTPAATTPADAAAVNTGEVWRFRVRIINNGQLGMDTVSVHIQGLNGALVGSTCGGPWLLELDANIPAPQQVGAEGMSVDTQNFCFKAPSTPTSAPVQLLKASIHDWSASLDHILRRRAGFHPPTPLPPGGIFSAQVLN